ncbi:hypothetical protein [Saccharothrix violaceirubra]|uniref:Transmembrane protein n=1 Tax=Saccharothrix violaceirubra TaxID=413306 RepID=A0A7W7T0J5_9PSEU|nr:hypothetical protein [Saccharothrix violaceirubra]MBB4964363.1 hypothetical protein [Saccharothrix violaceirubra]
MKWYADRPVRLVRQLVADVLAAAWTWFWVTVALGVRDAVLTLRAPGEALASAGRSLGDTFAEAAAKARDVPLVGDNLADALGRGDGAGDTLATAGTTQIEAVETTALWLTVAFIAVPTAFLLLLWLPVRLRYARRAGAARRLRAAGRMDLLALQALTTLSPTALSRFASDPAAGWRAGDPDTVAALAAHRLRTLGLTP